MVDHGAHQRVYNAVVAIVDARPIRDRLLTAALELHPLKPDNFASAPQRELFEQIRADLTKLSASEGEGDIRATLRNMDDEAAVGLARRIVRLLYLIRDEDE